jgi:hypothetical protein
VFSNILIKCRFWRSTPSKHHAITINIKYIYKFKRESKVIIVTPREHQSRYTLKRYHIAIRRKQTAEFKDAVK